MDIKKSIISIICILLVALFCMLGINYLEKNKNKPTVVVPEKVLKQVKVIQATEDSYPVKLSSNGRVVAKKRVQLSAEVGGRIIKVNAGLSVGNVIKKDAVIVEIDKVDYDSALASALSAVADAKLQIQQEEARAAMNIKEWKRLGKGEANDLIKRVPQLESARARMLSAEATVASAKRNIKKTVIKAPYDFKVEEKYIEEGNLLMASGRIVDGYAEGELEISLSLPLDEFVLYEDKDKPIVLSTELGGKQLKWMAEFVRVIDVVDQATLSIPVIAKILPNQEQDGFKFPPLGLYLEATINAKELSGEGQLVIPRDVLKVGDIVLLVDQKNKLIKQKVEVIYTDKEKAVIKGLDRESRIVATPIENPVVGTEVEVLEDEVKKVKEMKEESPKN